jgi:solute carrier family 25 carnitine/acylcarnitine transporter 20/29
MQLFLFPSTCTGDQLPSFNDTFLSLFQKVRLQTQVTIPGQPPQYAGAVDALKKIWAQEGLGGLYKGVASPAMGVSAMNASMFFSYGQSRKLLLGGQERQLTMNEVLVAGLMTGWAISFVEGPFDHIKCKLQSQKPGKPGNYTGVFDAARRIGSQFGIQGIYQGLNATFLRNIPANGAYFYVYEGSRRKLTPEGQQPGMLANFTAGGLAGVGYWLSIYPLELIKTRIQSDSSVLHGTLIAIKSIFAWYLY